MTGESPVHAPKRRIFALLIFALLLFFLVVRASLTRFRALGPDEFQHLHASWMISQGYEPYRDFWENHTPLLYYLLSPLLRSVENLITATLVARTLLSAASLAILFLTYRLARRNFNRAISWLAVLLLSYSTVFAQRTIEVRPDGFLVICWLASLLLYLRAVGNGKAAILLLAGILLGVGFLFSPKIITCYFALSVGGLLSWYLQRSTQSFRSFARQHAIYTFAFLIPVGASLLFFYSLGTLQQFLHSTFFDNISYPDVRRPTYLLRIKYLSFFLLSVPAIGFRVREWIRNRSGSMEEVLILCPAVLLFLLFLFVMPAPYPQTILLFLPVFAIYAADLFWQSICGLFGGQAGSVIKAKHVLFCLLGLAALAIPMGDALLGAPFSNTNEDQFNRIRFVLNLTRSSERIFDAESSYIYRPQAYYYGSLVAGNRLRFPENVLQEQILKSLAARHCRIVFEDEWILLLPPGVRSFLQENYRPTLEPGVLIAGKKLMIADPRAGNISFSIAIPSRYTVRAQGPVREMQLDDVPYHHSRLLSAGNHHLSWNGRLFSVEIQADIPLLPPTSKNKS